MRCVLQPGPVLPRPVLGQRKTEGNIKDRLYSSQCPALYAAALIGYRQDSPPQSGQARAFLIATAVRLDISGTTVRMADEYLVTAPLHTESNI